MEKMIIGKLLDRKKKKKRRGLQIAADSKS